MNFVHFGQPYKFTLRVYFDEHFLKELVVNYIKYIQFRVLGLI